MLPINNLITIFSFDFFPKPATNNQLDLGWWIFLLRESASFFPDFNPLLLVPTLAASTRSSFSSHFHFRLSLWTGSRFVVAIALNLRRRGRQKNKMGKESVFVESGLPTDEARGWTGASQPWPESWSFEAAATAVLQRWKFDLKLLR